MALAEHFGIEVAASFFPEFFAYLSASKSIDMETQITFSSEHAQVEVHPQLKLVRLTWKGNAMGEAYRGPSLAVLKAGLACLKRAFCNRKCGARWHRRRFLAILLHRARDVRWSDPGLVLLLLASTGNP